MSTGHLFSFIIEKVCDVVLESNGIHLPAGPNEDSHPKLKDRAPYPPDAPIEILPPVDDAKTLEKRKAIDKEFWETI